MTDEDRKNIDDAVAERLAEIWPQYFGPDIKTQSGRLWSELVALAVVPVVLEMTGQA